MSYIPPASFYNPFAHDFLVNCDFIPPVGNPSGVTIAGAPEDLMFPGSGVLLSDLVSPAKESIIQANLSGSSTFPPSVASWPTPSSSSAVSVSPDQVQHYHTLAGNPPAPTEALPVTTRPRKSGAIRRRGPNRRRPGSGYSDLMVRSSSFD